MATERVVLRHDWSEEEIKIIYDNGQSAMKFASENTSMVSENYRQCLQRGREVIIEKMKELILDRGYFCPQYGTGVYVLNWRDAPELITKFLRLLESVFTRDKEIKIRKKILVRPAVRAATSAAANVTPTMLAEHWSKKAIEILDNNCQNAMNLLEKNPAIISGKYRQCLQRGRDVIINKMEEFIMDPEYFMQHGRSTEHQLYWKTFPRGAARFLQHIETVFTGDEEFQIREKKIVEVRMKTIAIPTKASLVALVEAREPRQKWGILRSYDQMNFFSANEEFQLEVLKGKRILNEKWAEEECYKLSGEANAMLCMHLWSLMRYVGFSKPQKIWEVISRGWPECVTWKEGPQGKFWRAFHSDEVPLRVQAENKGLKTILAAYKDMERHFKEDSEHSLIHYEDNPRPSR